MRKLLSDQIIRGAQGNWRYLKFIFTLPRQTDDFIRIVIKFNAL